MISCVILFNYVWNKADAGSPAADRVPNRPQIPILPYEPVLLAPPRESATLIQRSLQTGNLLIHNLREMLEKMNEEVDQDVDRDIKNLTLINQGTLRMSHLKVCES